jgi:biopolymer transport protein ExbD
MNITKHRLLLFTCIFLINKCFCQSIDTFRYSEPVDFHYPETRIKTVLPSDTTYFCIKITAKKNFVKLRGDWEEIENDNQLDRFVQLNKDEIDPSKILVIGKKDIPYSKFAFVLELLKKYDYMKFHLVAIE